MLTNSVLVALKDNEDQIGYCVSETVVPIQSIDEKTKTLKTDLIAKFGVCWEDDDKRCPAFQYYDSEQLIWLEILNLKDESNEESVEDTDEAVLDEVEDPEAVSTTKIPEENTAEASV